MNVEARPLCVPGPFLTCGVAQPESALGISVKASDRPGAIHLTVAVWKALCSPAGPGVSS